MGCQEYKLVNLLASDKSKAIATYTDKTGRDCRPGAWSVYSLSEFVGEWQKYKYK